ncbi:MAG: PemK family transcriptional regulator [Clostridiaceae bacterium]|nr:PemK family transcriptional regulator [Clostridiaceae bacterium]
MNTNEQRDKDKKKLIQRGEIYFADLGEGIGSEQNGIRPVLILQNNIGNTYSPTTIVAVITSIIKKTDLPVHIKLDKEISYLPQNSIVLLEQIKTIDKSRLLEKVSKLDDSLIELINKKLKISLGL